MSLPNSVSSESRLESVFTGNFGAWMSFELLEPTGEDSPISKFLEKRGPGIHHIAVEVDDIEAALAKLKARGVRLIDETPRTGAESCLVAFVHPSSTGGVLLELVQSKN